MTAPRAIFLKVTLLEIQPAIWRRFAVPAWITLPGLHRVLQAAMGWEDYHLHSFSFGDVTYGPTDPDWPSAMIEERGKRLRKLLDESGGEFTYEYDFGDGWTHRVEVADPFETKSRLPVCFDGARACPPEDCGGPVGIRELSGGHRRPEARRAQCVSRMGRRSFRPRRIRRHQSQRALAVASILRSRPAGGSPRPWKNALVSALRSSEGAA